MSRGQETKVIPSLLRRINERKILRVLHTRNEASRADLSRETGISYPTVSRIVSGLMEASILEEGEIRYLSLGRPARTLRAVSLTGCATFLNSNMAGWGVRSGQTRPLMQKFLSLGSSPKSPP